MILLILFAIVLLIVLREGYQQADSKEPSEQLSKIWHTLGGFMRAFIVVLFYLLNAHLYILIAIVFLLWPVYNIACNLGRKQHPLYLSDRGIDKLIKKVLFFVKFPKAK